MPHMMNSGMKPMMGEGGPPEDDLYGESDAPEEATDQSEENASKSALLPSNMFEGKPEPGDTITVKVDAVYDGEVEVSIVSKPTENRRSTIEEDLEEVSQETE